MKIRFSGMLSLLALSMSLSAPALAGEPGGVGSKLADPGAKPFTVTVARVAAQKGQPAKAQVVIKPGAGWHLNKDYPTTLKLRPPAGVQAQKADFSKADAALSEQEARFDVVLTSSEAGKKSVPGDLRFAVCSESTCDPQKSTVTIEMDVK
jgi:hypothetical protein